MLEYLPGGQISATLLQNRGQKVTLPTVDVTISAGNSQEDVDDLDRLMADDIDLSSELMTDVSNGDSLPGSGDLGLPTTE